MILRGQTGLKCREIPLYHAVHKVAIEKLSVAAADHLAKQQDLGCLARLPCFFADILAGAVQD